MRTLFSLLLLVSMIGLASVAHADEFKFNPENSNIKGSIRYAAIGEYKATFESYRGVLAYNPKTGQVTSVALIIKAATLQSSNCPLCDKAARSARLLDVKKYPNITFKSNSIIKKGQDFVADGEIGIHGEILPIRFPFKQESIIDGQGKKAWKITGSWDIPRKRFGIIWSKLLDHGGVIVGDHVTVKWDVTVPRG